MLIIHTWEQESYEIGSEDLVEQPNVWLPRDVLPGFREFTTMFYWRCFDVAKELLRAVALGIGLDDEAFFLGFHSGVNNQLRLLHYPPVEVERVANDEVARKLVAARHRRYGHSSATL